MPVKTIDYTKGELAAKFEIEVEYIHHLKELYKRIHRWLEEEDFKDPNGLNNFETLYWQRDLPNGLFEHHIWWRAHKHPGSAGDELKHITWFLKFNYQTVATSKTDIMHKGKKWKTYKSDTILRFEGHQLFDYSGWSDNPFLKPIQGRFHKWMYKDKAKFWEDQYVKKLVELQNLIKAFLKVQHTPAITPDPFPPSALPR